MNDIIGVSLIALPFLLLVGLIVTIAWLREEL